MLIHSTPSARWLIGLAALAALVALAAAGFASAGGSVWRQKVDASVLSRAEAGKTGFFVYLKDRADLSGADALGTKRAKGSYVYKRLTSTAQQTQAPLLAKLNSLGVRHESFWITNAIWVAGGVGAVQAMATRPEVEHVYAMSTGGLDAPVDTSGGVNATTAASLALTVGNNISHVNADDVWALGYTGQGVVVASADTGVEWTHPALKAKYRGWNGSTANHDYNWHDGNPNPANTPCPGPSPEPCDDDEVLGGGHGTHTTGTMVGDDGAGNQIGMAPGAKWIACRNMNNGVGVIPTYLNCMQWFIAPTKMDGSAPNSAKAPDVINNSWGCIEVCPPPALQDTLQASRAAGIFYAVSAGNDGVGLPGLPGCSTLQHPLARYPESFTVGATYIGTDAIAEFSSRGPVMGDPNYPPPAGFMKPNISAPGVDVRSSLKGGGYGQLSGTSMAGPHVAGLVALIISAKPSLRGNVDKIEDIIEQTAVHLTTNEGCGGDTTTQVPNNTFGWGRIDALAAIREATKTTTTPPGDAGDKATGGGWLADSNGAKINLGFNAKRKGTGFEGNLQLNDKAANAKIHLTQVTSLGAVEEPCGQVPEAASSLQFRGSGTFNGANARFRVCVQDNGEGSNAVGSDRLYLECTAGCSYDTGARTPDDSLDGGNVQVRRTTPVSGSGSMPSPIGAPQASVLVLDPLLTSGGVAGQAQLFTVTVYDQYQAPLSNASVTLTRTTPAGLVERLNGVTGVVGTVTFTALNLGQRTEYIARAGAAQSNAIEVSPLD